MHMVVTDSGIGGLSVCAEIECNIRRAGRAGQTRITYFNAWPEQHSGYNDMPDVQSRTAAFERALRSMARRKPDRILIACNTLSILYPMTGFSTSGGIPVVGIIESGIDLFCEALEANPRSTIAILGTRTTIDSGVHRDLLEKRGIADGRIITAACHGLAAAIERDPGGPAVKALIDKCAAEVSRGESGDGTLYAGLACTHYTYVKETIRTALEACARKKVVVLDPNRRMAEMIAPRCDSAPPGQTSAGAVVEVISKVELDDSRRRAIAALLSPISDATARALLYYSHDPGLF